jgi:hypothetical protein
MNTNYSDDQSVVTACKFITDSPTANFQAAKRFAEQSFVDQDRQQSFLKAFFDISVKKAEFQSDVERMWPERKDY